MSTASSVESVDSAEDRLSPERLVTWTLERFAGRRVMATTAFGMEGCALIDMIASHHVPFTVIYLDTMFFFPETYALRDRLIERYPHLTFVNAGTSLTPEQQAARHGPALWERDPDLCCQIRKVDPMQAAVAGWDVWMTALGRTQSAERAQVPFIEWDRRFGLLKVSPLVHWDRERVWRYIQERDVPYNELHQRGYPTVGCMQCTSAVPDAGVTEYTREGRWSGSSKQECGLHVRAGQR
jgi:phosphoadenosine phosphosulfate reductase